MIRSRFFKIIVILMLLQLAGCAVMSRTPTTRNGLEAGETITVKPNENIYTIAREHNVSMRDMIALNDLQPPFAVHVGQSLTLPADATGGNAMHGYAPPPSPAPLGVIEQSPLPPLQPVQSAPLSQPVPTSPRSDSRLPLSGATASASPLSLQPQSQVNELNKPLPPIRVLPTTVAAAAPVPTASKPTDLAQAIQNSATMAPPEQKPADTSFSAVWPVQGPILSNYGPKGQGLNNDGVNIGGPKGASVVAAAGGTVVYAGNEMKGFGNLILIRHSGGYVTAYAHLDRMMVMKDTMVAQGDMIGTIGKTGNVSSPQLHFEVRQGNQTIDPNTVIKDN